MNRSCAGCGADISYKHKNAKYCDARCKDAPRFRGTYCKNCNEPLIIGRTNVVQTKYCTPLCQQTAKRLDYLEQNPNFKEDFFEKAGLQNSYWAGFIAADGCIATPSCGQKRLQIKLSAKDRSHLEKFQKALGVGKIHTRQVRLKETQREYERVEYAVTSDKLCSDLHNTFNIGPRKTFALEPPPLTGDLAKAFIAGYIDGDGCYFKVHSKLRISVLGTYSILEWIARTYGVPRKLIKDKRGEYYYMTFYGQDAINMAESFYKMQLPLLERKKRLWVTDIDDEIEVKC